ncbi:hypothetical protein Tco_0564175 [Tanacetum coccineum]
MSIKSIVLTNKSRPTISSPIPIIRRSSHISRPGKATRGLKPLSITSITHTGIKHRRQRALGGDENPIRTLGDYSKPSHEGYRNTIELPVGNNVVPLRSDTIRLVQNGCSFHGLRSEDLNQHLKDFLKLVDSFDLDGENMEITRLRLFQFSLRDQASNWLERLPAGSITIWEDLTTRESLSKAWTRFKDLLRKVPYHGIDLWLQVQIFYDRINHTLKKTVDYTVGGRLRKMSAEKSWATIKELARYEDEGWNDPIIPEKEGLNYENPDLKQLLGIMECKVGTLMEEAITLMGRSEIKKLEEYMGVIRSDFMQLSLEVVGKLKEEIRMEENRTKKIKKITRYPDTKDLEPLNGYKFSEVLTEKASLHTPKFVSPKSLCVKHVRTIFPSPPLIRESTIGFKSGTKNNRNRKSRHDAKKLSPQSTTQTQPSFEEYTPPVTYPEEVENNLGTPIEVAPLNETKLEEVGLNCNHNTPFSSREVPSFDGPEPQPLLNSPSLDVNLRDVIGPEPPIKPHSPDSSRMKVVDYLTIQTPPLPYVVNSHPKGVYSYYNPGIDNPKRHYGFKLGLLGKGLSIGVDISNWEMFDDDWGLESKEVSPLGVELSLFDRPNEVERCRILKACRLESILQQQISQRMAPSHHDVFTEVWRAASRLYIQARRPSPDTCDGVRIFLTESIAQLQENSKIVRFDEKKLGSS